MSKLIDLQLSARVLFFGVSKKSKGGMTSVVLSYDRHIDRMRFIPTWHLGSKLTKGAYMLQALCRANLKLLTDRRISIVHIHGAANASFHRCRVLIRLAKWFGKKVILHEHAADFKEFFENSTDKTQIAATLRSIDHLIVLSESWKLYFESIGVPAEKIIVLNNPVEAPDNPTPHAAHTPLRLLYLGEISNRKGAFDLLQAIADNRNYFSHKLELRMGGNIVDGDIRAFIRENNMQDFVSYLGWVAGSAKESLLRWADLYILPSYNEGLPVAILEAMSHGIPVISTPVGGIPEIVHNGSNGTIVQPGNTDEITTALKYYIENPDVVAQQGRQSISDVQPYFPAEVFGKLRNIYIDLLQA